MIHRYVIAGIIALSICVTSVAQKPSHPLHKKGLHKKYTVTMREETVLPEWLNSLPQYRIWQKKKKDLQYWAQKYGSLPLPDSAVIIDEKVFATPKGQRTILAWMTDINIDLHTYEYSVYSGCPGSTTGTGYYSGQLHFSLLNTATGKTINTIDVFSYDSGPIIYPFSIANPEYQPDIFDIIYAAHGGNDTADGEADIIHLIDFNNDGKAYEFALFHIDACVPPASTLIGYNDKEDKLKWHEWHMTVRDPDDKSADSVYSTTEHWVGPTMTVRLDKKGSVKFAENELGRSGALMIYDMHYDTATDTYAGERTIYTYFPNAAKHILSAKKIRDKYRYK